VKPTEENTLEMNEHQRKDYGQPLGAGPLPPPGHFVHPEVSGRVPLNVSLTADGGPEVADRFGAAVVWHCSGSAWPRARSFVARGLSSRACYFVATSFVTDKYRASGEVSGS
jgi:hypothetical protein